MAPSSGAYPQRLKHLFLQAAAPETPELLSWCPINGFDKLPPGREHLNLQSETEDVDALLGSGYAGKSLPESLRLFCDVQKERDRSLEEEDQETDDRNLRAIEALMTQLPLREIENMNR
ncbi:uncharacterized protein Z519_10400 [Cladophialophora bantiana CBS 173.52]|uniref:Uncharacterized protein n=1 Tax=Cladophialophora bantiana (strain ATCC 10958 / CBS 173.52 / CDC B-1940 / NIH 8579) TaxID=1442370 RepID=A0A0D2EFT9_CLAB1|nr:uncharacterized protein Z519_10400 [Cladophialophora bantiana CBS 173.52]KIW88916.1 hypothetical protein Z519_10400 [Cladophialophora bantiana CBS 173.52]